MVVQQTYGGFLNFYPHLHTLVSAGGLEESCVRRVHDLKFRKEGHQHELMLAWRFALLAYLDAATRANVLNAERSVDKLAHVLKTESQRDWIIFVGRRVSKDIVIDHIGRYIRKPPIAQYRLTRPNAQEGYKKQMPETCEIYKSGIPRTLDASCWRSLLQRHALLRSPCTTLQGLHATSF
jgi:hypothetical protein